MKTVSFSGFRKRVCLNVKKELSESFWSLMVQLAKLWLLYFMLFRAAAFQKIGEYSIKATSLTISSKSFSKEEEQTNL